VDRHVALGLADAGYKYFNLDGNFYILGASARDHLWQEMLKWQCTLTQAQLNLYHPAIKHCTSTVAF
jgi:hypothetical protein